jgi:hypothetical protein
LYEFIAARPADIVLAVPIVMLAVGLLAQIPNSVDVDSWLELVTGRLVWQHGIPTHETLTAIQHGVRWVDQQWLSQLTSYALYRIGGFGLLGLVNVTLLVSGVAIATYATRRLGAPFRSALVVLPLCAVMITPSRELRTQEFVVPLFAIVTYLLARDSRQPSRRVFWCLPILVLWANLHGSVTLGAGLVALHGLMTLWQRRDSLLHRARAWVRPLALMVGPVVAMLITPYGLAILGYYRGTMVSSELRHMVTEWQPVTSSTTTSIAMFLVAALAIWSFGRNPSKTTTFEKLAFLILAAATIEVVRNSLFFALFAMMILPVSLAWGDRTAERRSDHRRTLINGAVAGLALFGLLIATVATLVKPSSSVEFTGQRRGVLTAVERVTRADPSIRVMSDEHFDDWLLWRDPALAGKVAADVRYEIMAPRQLQGLEALFSQTGPDWKRAARGYRLLVLDKPDDPGAYTTFRRESGARVLYNDGTREVILRSPAEAAQG